MNYHPKSGDSSLKFEWVMINFMFWQPFSFWDHLFCGFLKRHFCWGSIWTTRQNLELLAWKLGELYQFCVLVAIYFIVWNIFLQKVNMNYHAKSGASSLKIERVLINFVFWWPFCFLCPFSCFGKKNVECHYELSCKIWSF